MRTLGWDVFYRRGQPPETMPAGDLREHDPGKHCWCRPLMDEDVLVHNSMDLRESYETGMRRLH